MRAFVLAGVFCLGLGGLPTCGPALAQSTDIVASGDDALDVQKASQQLMPVYGNVFGADETSIVIRTDEGKYVTATIAPDASLLRSRMGTLADVRAGKDVATGSVKDEAGNLTAREIIVSPPAGSGTAQSPVWFKESITAFDKGNVTQVAATAQGAAIRVAAPGGAKEVSADSKTIVTILEAASVADLQRGVRVRALVAVNSDGSLAARLIEIASP